MREQLFDLGEHVLERPDRDGIHKHARDTTQDRRVLQAEVLEAGRASFSRHAAHRQVRARGAPDFLQIMYLWRTPNRLKTSRDYNRRYKSFRLMIPPELDQAIERNRYVEGLRANTSTSRGCLAFDVGLISYPRGRRGQSILVVAGWTVSALSVLPRARGIAAPASTSRPLDLALLAVRHMALGVTVYRAMVEHPGAPPVKSSTVRGLVDYMLFVDEAPLSDQIQGTSGFEHAFRRAHNRNNFEVNPPLQSQSAIMTVWSVSL